MNSGHNRPAPFLTAMLEGSFSCLICLATIALIGPDNRSRSLALMGFAAITIAILVMLAMPSSWIRRRTDCHARETDPNQPAAQAEPRPETPSIYLQKSTQGEHA